MLPRRNQLTVVWMALVLQLVLAASACGQETHGSPSVPGLIHFYQAYISPVDGHRCPMKPSCSTYVQACIEKHGLLVGWIMGVDRWVRCGRDEVKTSAPVWIKGKRYTLDPVENNDFWWSEK